MQKHSKQKNVTPLFCMLGACAVCRLHNNKYTAGAVLTRACLWVALLHFSSISFTLLTTMLSHYIIPHTFPSTNVTWLAASWPIREGQPLAIDGAMSFKTWPNIRGISFAIDTSELWWGIGTGSTACLSSIGTGHTAGSPLWPQSPVTVNCIGVWQRGLIVRVCLHGAAGCMHALRIIRQIYAVCVCDIYSLGQLWMLHSSDSIAVPSQRAPPYFSTSCSRRRNCWPPPHSRLQLPHSPHGIHTQSTGDTINHFGNETCFFWQNTL